MVQAIFPEISFYKGSDNSSAYRVFGINGIGTSGKNPLSVSWKRSVGEFSGQFNFTMKEDLTVAAASADNLSKPFLDVVEPLDVVVIKHDSSPDTKPDFIGFVTDISFTASAGGLQKTISITGKSIEHLLELYCISMDATAMLFAGDGGNVEAIQKNYVADMSAQGNSVAVKDMLKKVYESFDGVAKRYPGISNTRLSQMIQTWMGSDFFDCGASLRFHYPISSNLFSNSTINYPDYVRNLLPQPLYEFHGIVQDGKPKVRCREVPFDGNEWKRLKSFTVVADILTGYSLARSNGEVYTVFIPYLEGSPIGMNFYQVQSTDKGYPHSCVAKDKLELYGYRPLNCNFVGFKTEGTAESDMTETFRKLAERLMAWYSRLDEMYDVNLSMVLRKGHGIPELGGRVKFGDGEFYVTSVEYSWSYGASASIKCHGERGGKYQDGVFATPLTGLSRPRMEADG